MNHLRTLCAAAALTLAAQNLFGASEPKDENLKAIPPTPSDAVLQAIKTQFPGAVTGAAKLNMDRGLEVYYVDVTGVKDVDTVEVCGGSAMINAPVMVLQASQKVTEKNLSDTVEKAAIAATTDPDAEKAAANPKFSSGEGAGLF